MVMSMDAINDQTMSSTFDDSATINSDSYKQPESADDDLNDDELSKGSSQTVVVKRQQQQQQQQQQQPASADEDDDEKCHQPMIVSRGSSIDEDQKQTKMNLDEDSSSDEPLPPSATKLVSKTEECTVMKQPLPTAASLRLASGMDSKNTRVDSLVAQMRDIVDGGQTSRMSTESTSREHHQDDNRPQPKSSSDSLNNQNEISTSKASIEGVGAQKRTRRTRGHCRHGHHHHHHHHHHQGVQQRHKQDSEKSSIVEVDNAGVGNTCDSASQSHNPHPHHHHHHHRHQASSSSAHRQQAHSHSHPHHHHHHHHGHHHHPHHHHHREHHHQGERRGTMSKRSSIQRPSLALIDPTGGSLNLVSGTCQIGDEEEANRDLNSSMSSTSSNPAAAVGHQSSKQASQQNINNNPSQSYPDSKSSETPPDEKNSGEVDATTEMQQQQQQRDTDKSQEQPSGHHQHRHHHHHHHRCHHRSHKKRLILDSSNDFKSSTKADEQGTQTLEGEDAGTKREVLGDLKSSLNTSPGTAGHQLDHENLCEAHSISKGASQSHGHPHSHSHHHHHHPHSHHHHHIHCVASTNKLTNDNNQSKSTEEQQANKAQHHQHHRHHKHHHHYHHHGHHCKQHRHKTRQKSDVQSNVDLSSSRDQTNNQSTSTTGGGVKLDSSNNSNDCNVENAKLASADVPTTNQRRASTVSTAADGAGGKMNMDLEVSNEMQTINDKEEEAKEDGVVDMEMSPSNKRRSSRVQQQTCESSSSTNLPEPGGAPMTTTHEAVILRSVRQEVVVSGARRASQLNALNQQDNNNNINQMQIQSAKDGDKNNSNQCSIEPNQKSTQNDESSAYKFNGSYESNQENRYKGSNVGDVSGRENKLVRQMSSHSSKKSQKDDVGRDGESQSQQLADYAPRPLQTASNQQSTQATQIIESSVPNDRRCRLCWCCCCPCSALSVREIANRTDTVKTDTDPSNSPTNKLPPTPNVPLEEVRSWGESFDKLMRCQAGRKVFQDFLRCEYSEENILFWSACEDLKKERDSKSIASKARDIYEDYISILSSKEVSLDSRVRDVINNNIKKPTSNIFDEAQLQIYTLMHRDSYPRFINSNMYKKLAQISASNSSRKSSS